MLEVATTVCIFLAGAAVSAGFYFLPGRKRASIAAFVVGGGLLLLSVVFFVQQRQVEARERELQARAESHVGLLLPDNARTRPCAFSDNSLAVIWGTNVTATTNDLQHIVMAGSDPLLSVRRNDDGTLSVSAMIYSRDGLLITELQDNGIFLPDKRIRFERPNYHSVMIFDHTGSIVLFVYLMNEFTLRVAGEFNAPGFKPLAIHFAGVPGLRIQSSCFVNSAPTIGLQPIP